MPPTTLTVFAHASLSGLSEKADFIDSISEYLWNCQ